MSKPVASAKIDNSMLGIFLMLGAYIFFSFIDTSAKWLALAGIVAFQSAFMRYIGALVVSFAIIGKGGLSIDRFATDKLGLVLLRSLLLVASTICNFVAVTYLPLTLTSTILFSSPIIICVLSWPLLGERVGVWRWGAIMLGFVGILIAIRPFGESFHWAVFCSLFSAGCFALYSVITRKLAGVVATDTLQFYVGLVGSVALAPVAILYWQSPDSLIGWMLMIGLGIFGWIGHELLTRAHTFAAASVLSPFGYTFILYLTAWSYFIFNHVPDVWTIVGALIIIGAGLIIWLREKKDTKLKRLSSL